MSKLEYTAESVARALDLHAGSGLIKTWTPAARPGQCALVVLTRGTSLELRTLREAYVFVSGLASAAQVLNQANA